ncbi:hypothetical protein Tco_1371570 [Tanacetum coccineum]
MVKTGLVEAIDSLVPLDEHLATFRERIFKKSPHTTSTLGFRLYKETQKTQEKEVQKKKTSAINRAFCKPLRQLSSLHYTSTGAELHMHTPFESRILGGIALVVGVWGKEIRGIKLQGWDSKEKELGLSFLKMRRVEVDTSKQGRNYLMQRLKRKQHETEPIIQEVTPTEVIQDQGSSEKGNYEVSTAGATKGTASEVPVVSTAEVNISTAGRTVTYRRRSEEKRTRKDKGKAIMTEPEPKKKSKKELEQERLVFAEAIRLQEQMDEEQRAQIARDEEIARQWDEEEGQRAMSEAKSSKKIDWNDPSVIRSFLIESGAKEKNSLPRKSSRSTVKRQKMELDDEKEDLKGYFRHSSKRRVA